MKQNRFIVLGAVSAALAVVFGAFGAHALKSRLSPEDLAIYHTAVQYHLFHSLGLLAIGLVETLDSTRKFFLAGMSMSMGILLFSGSLYALCLTQITAFGAITPIGGLLFIVAWMALAIGLLQKN